MTYEEKLNLDFGKYVGYYLIDNGLDYQDQSSQIDISIPECQPTYLSIFILGINQVLNSLNYNYRVLETDFKQTGEYISYSNIKLHYINYE